MNLDFTPPQHGQLSGPGRMVRCVRAARVRGLLQQVRLGADHEAQEVEVADAARAQHFRVQPSSADRQHLPAVVHEQLSGHDCTAWTRENNKTFYRTVRAYGDRVISTHRVPVITAADAYRRVGKQRFRNGIRESERRTRFGAYRRAGVDRWL